MAGNTRGKLKEHFEGIHRNFDWVMYHSQQCLGLIKDKNKPLSEAVKTLAEGVEALDKLTQDLYSKL